MATASNPKWTVLPHGPLEPLAEGLWRVQGSLPGMPLKRVMTLVRLASGDLVVHNPIAVDARVTSELESLGPVTVLVVPNGWHRLDLPAFREKYPSARVIAPRGSVARVAKVAPEVGDLSAFPSDPAVALAVVEGMGGLEAVMTVGRSDGISVVFADAVFNMPHVAGAHGFVLRHITGSSGGPRVSRVARLFMVKDKRAFAAHLNRLATPDLKRVIVAHHEMIVDDPAGTLRRVAASVG